MHLRQAIITQLVKLGSKHCVQSYRTVKASFVFKVSFIWAKHGR